MMEIHAMPFLHKTSVVSRKQFDDHVTLYQKYITMTNKTVMVFDEVEAR